MELLLMNARSRFASQRNGIGIEEKKICQPLRSSAQKTN